ncbi:hypothetical protein A9G05_15410 [Pseudomonas sp. ENNP23]|nr:hypothetical protein A9G05_15410 [Pseudomonas sp. ENNP23]
MAVGGRQAGTLFEGDLRFDLMVSLDEGLRTDPQGLPRLLLPLPGGTADGIAFIPPADVATLDLELGPNQISRENGKRLVVVSANVRGRDIGSFVAEARIQAEVRLLLATVVIGGILSSTALTLLVLPVLYQHEDDENEADERG